jgi:tRNA(fMet)-specific endonuclease VapC
MPGVLIDTSVLVAAERGELDLPGLSSIGGASIAVAAITAHELIRGISRLPAGIRRARSERWFESLMSTVAVIDYDLEVARVHAALWVELASMGVTLGKHDQMIAATALVMGYDLATRDSAFKNVPDLKLLTW